MLQPMVGGEHADARAVEVSGRLKAAGGAMYGHGPHECRGRRTALKGLYPRRTAGGGCGAQPRQCSIRSPTDKEERVPAERRYKSGTFTLYSAVL